MKPWIVRPLVRRGILLFGVHRRHGAHQRVSPHPIAIRRTISDAMDYVAAKIEVKKARQKVRETRQRAL